MRGLAPTDLSAGVNDYTFCLYEYLESFENSVVYEVIILLRKIRLSFILCCTMLYYPDRPTEKYYTQQGKCEETWRCYCTDDYFQPWNK